MLAPQIQGCHLTEPSVEGRRHPIDIGKAGHLGKLRSGPTQGRCRRRGRFGEFDIHPFAAARRGQCRDCPVLQFQHRIGQRGEASFEGFGFDLGRDQLAVGVQSHFDVLVEGNDSYRLWWQASDPSLQIGQRTV